MANISFRAAYSTTLEGSTGVTEFSTVYAEDLGNCQDCIDSVSSCWACLNTGQQIFSDSGLTTPVTDGYYRVEYSEGNPNAIWYVVGGFPQTAGFYN